MPAHNKTRLNYCRFFTAILLASSFALLGASYNGARANDFPHGENTSSKGLSRDELLGNRSDPQTNTLVARAKTDLDVLAIYGQGINRTCGTIASALRMIGTERKARIWLSPGIWKISVPSDWSSYSNITFVMPEGTTLDCDFDVTLAGPVIAGPNAFDIAKGKALRLHGEFNAGLYQVFSGDGKVIIGLRSVYPQWFGAKGDGTHDDTIAIIRATKAASPNEVYFNDGVYIVDGKQRIASDVNWRGKDAHRVIIKKSPASHRESVFRFTGSVVLQGITFDGSRKQNKGLELSPGTADSIHIKACIFKNFMQPADADGQAKGGFSAGIAVYGNHNRFVMTDCEVTNIDATGKPGRPRPTSRGVNWSTRTLVQDKSHQDGSSRLAIVESCSISNIKCGDNWGNPNIDADGIVWRTLENSESKLIIKNCRFWSCAKRPIKANIACNIAVSKCYFTEKGKSKYLNLSFQSTKNGSIKDCIFDFPSSANFPKSVFTVISTRSTMSTNCEFSGNKVYVRDCNPVGDSSIISLGGTDVRNLIARDNYVHIPGGIDRFLSIRMYAQPSPSVARRLGARGILVEKNSVQKINGDFVHYSKSGSGYTFQKLRVINNILIGSSRTVQKRYRRPAGKGIEVVDDDAIDLEYNKTEWD